MEILDWLVLLGSDCNRTMGRISRQLNSSCFFSACWEGSQTRQTAKDDETFPAHTPIATLSIVQGPLQPTESITSFPKFTAPATSGMEKNAEFYAEEEASA